jgi:hypothetical protein
MSLELVNQKIDAAFESAQDGYAQKLRVALKEAMAEIFTSISEAGGATAEGAMIKQGDYDPSITEAFPTSDNTIDNVAIKKGFCWELTSDAWGYSAGDFICANLDNAGNDINQWDVIVGHQISQIQGAFIMQGDFDVNDYGTYPTSANTIGAVAIQKGFAWKSITKYTIDGVEVGVDDIMVAKVDNPSDTVSTDWVIIQGNTEVNPFLLAQLINLDATNITTATFDWNDGKNLDKYFVTSIVVKVREGNWSDMTAFIKDDSDNNIAGLNPPSITDNMYSIYQATGIWLKEASNLNFDSYFDNGSTLKLDIFVYGLPY